MKVVAINGSARKNGNTDIMINEVFNVLKENNIEVETISLSKIIINPCKACFTCGGKNNCTFNDDEFNKIFNKIKEADGIILASPSYSANISSNLQAVIERSAVIADMNPGLLKHKVGAAIVCARRGGEVNVFDNINNFFLNHEMFVVGSTYWNIGYGQMPGDVKEDKEAMDNMKNLGENISFLLNKLNK